MKYNGRMDERVMQQLFDLNREFYQTFGLHFSSTRKRIQEGVRKILKDLPQKGNLLDLGCGNGNLALAWAKSNRQGYYLGADQSWILIEEAKKIIEKSWLNSDQKIQFLNIDFSNREWNLKIPNEVWDGIFLFAVMHHIPGYHNRVRILNQIHSMLGKGKNLYISNWQLQNSPKLLKHVQDWEKIGLTNAEVEENDCLLDWRLEAPNKKDRIGLRYVHVLKQEEMENIAHTTGFEISDQFFSDGKNGRLALYSILKVI